jgi:hypothetical protein
MLKDSLHPEKITKGNKRFKIEIMKDGYILSPVNNLLVMKAIDDLHLLQQVFQVLLVTIGMGIDPYILKKSGAPFYIQ